VNTFALELTDGLLTALVLTAGVFMRGTVNVEICEALRISVATALSGLFTVFVSDYARPRDDLIYVLALVIIGFTLGQHGRKRWTLLLLVGGAMIALAGVWLDVMD
jgi:hypothetical protein